MTFSDETQIAGAANRLAASQTPLQSIVRGSAWTIATRWSVRGIGLINTVILARLLRPTDFGIVAMATVAMGLIRVFSEAGQDLAVIRHANPTAEHFDTAWTMSVCGGVIVALVLVAIAPLAGWYFHEPRVVPVLRFIALAPLIDGFANIGAVAGFRRSLLFRKDFSFTMVRQLSTAVVAVPLALVWPSYWALAIGIVGGRLVGILASYRLHPYRPRLRLTRLRELWSYSAWTQIAGIGGFFGEQADQVIVGGLAGASPMGAYNVAADLATAPTQELVAPLSRATFPVYATLLQEPARLAQSYLSVLSFTAIIALSTGFGVALVSRDFVAVVLGAKWMASVRLVSWLAVGGGILGVARSVNGVIGVTGNARLNAMRIWAFAVLLLPAAILGGLGWGAEGIAAARTIVAILFVPIMFYSLTRVIPVSVSEILGCLWRPAIATATMVTAVLLAGTGDIAAAPLRLFCNVGLGAAVFAASLLMLWFLAGRPAGAERVVIDQLHRQVRRMTKEAIGNGSGGAPGKTNRAADDAPFFIVGAGRSGTTLLRLMLAGHSRIHIPPETWFVRNLVKELPLEKPLAPDQVARAVEIITTDYRWADMAIAADDLKRWAEQLESPKLVDIINLVYHRQLKRYGKRRFGDKTPNYISILPQLDALYGDTCKFIHLIRDGRDVAISTIDMSQSRYYRRMQFGWSRAMRFYREYLRSPLGAQILEVRYEDLVLQPETTVRRICAFLGEQFEPEMLEWRNRINLVPQREMVIHSKLGRPLSKDSVGVWQHKLSAWECFAIEACLQRDLRWLGYRLRFAGIAWYPVLAAVRWGLWVAGPLLTRAIPYLQRRHLLRQEIYI